MQKRATRRPPLRTVPTGNGRPVTAPPATAPAGNVSATTRPRATPKSVAKIVRQGGPETPAMAANEEIAHHECLIATARNTLGQWAATAEPPLYLYGPSFNVSLILDIITAAEKRIGELRVLS
jgi:hypothetical protein